MISEIFCIKSKGVINMNDDNVLHIHYEQPHALAKFVNESTYRALIRAIRKHVKPGAKILDIGCGRGELLQLLAASGYEVFGCDMDAECVRLSSKYANVQQLTVEQIASDKFECKFDLVVMSHVLEHIENPSAMMNRLKGMSKHLLISVPNPYYLTNIVKSFLRIPARHVNAGHLYSWDWDHFKTFIELGHDCRVEEWFYDSVALPVPSIVRRFLMVIGILPIIEDNLLRFLLPRFSRSITAFIEI